MGGEERGTDQSDPFLLSMIGGMLLTALQYIAPPPSAAAVKSGRRQRGAGIAVLEEHVSA